MKQKIEPDRGICSESHVIKYCQYNFADIFTRLVKLQNRPKEIQALTDSIILKTCS